MLQATEEQDRFARATVAALGADGGRSTLKVGAALGSFWIMCLPFQLSGKL